MMINQTRKLLLGRKELSLGGGLWNIATTLDPFPATKYPADVHRVVNSLRRILFGSSLDAYKEQLLLNRYLQLLRSSRIGKKYLASLDPRNTDQGEFTHLGEQAYELFVRTYRGPEVEILQGSSEPWIVTNFAQELTRPKDRLSYSYQIEVVSPTELEIRYQEQLEPKVVTKTFATVDNLSEEILLPEGNLRLQIVPEVGDIRNLLVYFPLQEPLSETITACQGMSLQIEEVLFLRLNEPRHRDVLDHYQQTKNRIDQLVCILIALCEQTRLAIAEAKNA